MELNSIFPRSSNPSVSEVEGKDERVAVIAVHGVADQVAGQTALELARFLQAECAGTYSHFEQTPLILPVVANTTGQSEGGIKKDGWFHSEFTAQRLDQQRAERHPDRHADISDTAQQIRPVQTSISKPYDIAYSESLMVDLIVPPKEQAYQTTFLRGKRRASHNHRQQTVDIYELYWADLSRLGNSLLRIAGELYQLLFHLAYLAKTVIAHARTTHIREPADARRWRALHVTHGACEWLLTRPIALINLYQFIISLALVMVLLPVKTQPVVGLVVVAALGVAVVALIQLKFGFACAVTSFVLLFAASIVGLAPLITLAKHPAWLLFVALAVGTLGYALIVKSLSKRIFGIGVFGYIWPGVLGLLTILLPRAIFEDQQHHWVTFAVRAMEINVYVLTLSLFLLLLSSALLYLMGIWIRCQKGPRRASDRGTITTARVGTYLASMLFILLTLTASGLVVSGAQDVWPDIEYQPLFTSRGESTMTLKTFVSSVMRIRATSFGPVAALLGVTVLVSLYAMGLSLAREVSSRREWVKSEVVGRWLDDGLVLLGTALTVIFFVYVMYGTMEQVFAAFALWDPAHAIPIYETDHFDIVIKLMAGSAATMIALGSRIGNVVRSFRSVLDVFLDVDNYFKDRPASETPRGRIFARYVSLLDHVARYRFADGGGYDRVVIVAHSQGTVITADLFRTLSLNGSMAYLFGQRPLHLLTAGCPLRQLYAARFPDLYPWVVGPLLAVPADGSMHSGEVSGPDPRSLSVARWTNVYQSGDYVGRYLWDGNVRPNFYSKPQSADDLAAIFKPQHATAEIREMCVGSGAHIHYFDGSAPLVAGEVDRLIANA
jgi:hypothetical protein